MNINLKHSYCLKDTIDIHLLPIIKSYFPLPLFIFFFLIRNNKAQVKLFITVFIAEQAVVVYLGNRIQLDILVMDRLHLDLQKRGR